MLKNKFTALCQNFSRNNILITELWNEIQVAHTNNSRHYHSLEHLEQIYKALQGVELTPHLEFAIFYHDIVYDVKRDDNEEQSALFAKKRLESLALPLELIEKVFQLIMETKTHEASSEINGLFLDADLSILGSDEKTYEAYTNNVRKEYAFYDETTYFSGRKKVLKMFLDKEKIYKSRHFFNKYEKQARVNMLIEYNSLN